MVLVRPSCGEGLRRRALISRDFSFYLHTGESLDSPSLASGLATPSATLKAINELVVETAVKLGVEDGSKLRSPGRVHRLGDAAMAAVVEIRGGGGPGRGKKGGAEAHLLLPKDDPGKDTAIRWRKLCDKVKVEGKTKRETGRGKKHSQQ
jgi:hypothetical protein